MGPPGWSLTQQRLLRVPPVDQIPQRQPARGDPIAARVGLGESESCLGPDAIVALAPLAPGGVQRGVHLLDEERIIHGASGLEAPRSDAASPPVIMKTKTGTGAGHRLTIESLPGASGMYPKGGEVTEALRAGPAPWAASMAPSLPA